VNKGLIFDIRRFSVHDGPGIRTTVFFKGCPLTCWWCHNPESRAEVPEKTVRHLALEGKKFPVEETTGRYMSIEEVLSEALKDRLFYEESKGGVTLSGGEPMLQAEFAAGLLSALKEAGTF
jgi:pyruvate formate lyase activating enzyme